jgi:HTH-type transcriptional regulator/antitoxin HigA
MPSTVRNKVSGRNRAAVKTQYVQLLSELVPVVIETEAENERALRVVETLMHKVDRTEAESGILKLLAVLIGDFEQKHYSLGEASPLETLKELMSARDMAARDLWPIFGSKGIVSEVLSGKRGISKVAAKRLGETFSVSPALFI